MSILFSELKERVGSTIGTCSPEKASELAIDVLKYLQTRGAFGSLQKWRVWAKDCWITLPNDMDTPKKVSINGNPRPVQNFWHEFNDVHSIDSAEFFDNDRIFCDYESGGIRIEPGYFATAYDLPPCGGFLYFAPIQIPGCPLYEEEEGIEGIIHGKEANTNIEVNLAHYDNLARGEVLNISPTEPKFSTVKYREISNIIKPKTRNRIGLYWQPTQTYNRAEGGLLAEFDPFETKARFRRAYIPQLRNLYNDHLGEDYGRDCGVCLTILGTIRIKDYYDDNEILPFDTSIDFKLVSKYLHSIFNASNSDEMNVARVQKSLIEENISKGWESKTSYTTPLNIINFRRRKLGKVH